MKRATRNRALGTANGRQVRAEFRRLRSLSLASQRRVSLETWASFNDFVRAMARHRPHQRPRDAGFKL